ncbi:MAG: hypothetical protein ACYTGW_14710 [Planctomycetota bacterium]|jgi:DNA-directed RNA polymerase subunit N (RpoN/RPB10)
MEVHRQQCQDCGGNEVNNILVREANLPTVIYVRCASCGDLVARYELSDYYHHGRGIESFLRSKMATVEESGRHMLEMFEESKRKAIEGYKAVLDELARKGKKL